MPDTGYYLLDNPPARSQYRHPRREQNSGVFVIHTAESRADTVGPDSGCDNVAAFIRGRSDPGSYHALADGDSTLKLVPWWYEAWQDGTGSNPHAIGLSVACQAAAWPSLPESWRQGAISGLAALARDAAGWLKTEKGIVVPPRIITRAESERRIPGFIAHGTSVGRDPARRSDPGTLFPWDMFLGKFADGIPEPEPEIEMTPSVAYLGTTRYVFVRGTNGALWCKRGQDAWKSLGGVLTSGPDAVVIGGNLEIVVRGADTASWSITVDGNLTPVVAWNSLGGSS